MATAIDSSSVRLIPVDFSVSQKAENNQQEARSVKNVSEWAGKEGMLSTVFDMQSVRSADVHAAAVAQKNGGGEVNAQSAMPTVTLSAAGEGDTNKAERLASAAPNVMAAQTNITQPNNKSAESKSSVDSTGNTTNNAVGQTRSQPAVEGGTDITGADAAKPTFINVIGPMSQIEVSNILMKVLLESENTQNLSAAKASTRAIDATARSAALGVNAAEERRDGAIVGGVTAAVAQGGMAVASVRAMSKENTSLKTNAVDAKQHNFNVEQQKNTLGSVGGNMTMDGQRMESKIKESASHPQAEEHLDASLKQIKHSEVQNNTQKVRVVADLGNQLANTTRNITEGAYNVNAAEVQGEADLARADGNQHSELANTHKEVAKKAAETRAALNQATESVLNANNSAASSISERMRG
ncbi:hypothetical protein [Kluyvera intermedia]|uniref:Type III secretion system protein n=1 Tax=Kluyvera intermedia TaxID=61648 RepID=A0ABX6DRQ0_KLUIN|nr:hypothetical protein [Kluyvera intermedia]QGH29861.1 hypothetical protein GHC21_09405 [Kluyvera intermedia]QGH38843.1 hypothetical protein GHC38_09405 [Kluyvera intermedia]